MHLTTDEAHAILQLDIEVQTGLRLVEESTTETAELHAQQALERVAAALERMPEPRRSRYLAQPATAHLLAAAATPDPSPRLVLKEHLPAIRTHMINDVDAALDKVAREAERNGRARREA